MVQVDGVLMRNGTRDEALERLIHAVIGAAIEVHRALGPGYLESVYEEALCVELEIRRIPFSRQVDAEVQYKSRAVDSGIMDILVSDGLVVELKAVERLAPIHTAQVLSYLKATKHPVGLLINFNVVVLREGIKRVVLSNPS
ncbi:MAG TPA: GxxExxY protein [Thermomicrobiales bacterium]